MHERGERIGKRVQALGGAKNHAVVMPDADLDFAANHLTAAGFGSAGQRCMAIAVAVAVGDAAEPLVERLQAKARGDQGRPRPRARLRDGPGGDRRRRASGSSGYIDGGEAGATWSSTAASSRSTATASSSARRCSTASRPRWTSTATRSSARCSAVVRVETLDEAIELINANSYANGTAIFTGSSGEAARTFQRQIQVGMIGINVPIPVPMAFYSFGGWKDSLFGDHHVHGPEGDQASTRAARWSRAAGRRTRRDPSHMHFPTAT